MIRRPAGIWSLFVVLLLGMAAMLVWLTSQSLALERAEWRTRRQAELEERVRRALWRMDALLMPFVVREASRPDAFYITGRPIVGTPQLPVKPESAAKTGDELGDDYVLAHFQIPTDQSFELLPGSRDNRVVDVAKLRTTLTYSQLLPLLPKVAAPVVDEPRAAVAGMNKSNPKVETSAARQQAGPSQVVESFSQQAVRLPQKADEDARQRNSVVQAFANPNSFNTGSGNRAAAPGDPGAAEGTSRALWMGANLVVARRVARPGQPAIQGCVLDWTRLSERLKTEVAGILQDFTFAPAKIEDASHTLATLPVRIVVSPVDATPQGFSGVRLSLMFAWGALVIAAGAGAATLASVLSLAERRAAFVAAVTHELRTPLTTFRIYADMLAQEMVPAEHRGSYLETLRVEADRLGHLVDNVLQYARLERGRPRVARQTIAISDLMERLRPRFEARVAQVKLRLDLEMDAHTGLETITVDTAALEQILFNLVDNACKYAASGEGTDLKIQVTASANRFRWQVRDSGPGISLEQRRRLFQPFSKTVDQAAASAPGVGLGLALSRRLARELGGDLRLESTDATGAVFLLEIPRTS